ncbi:MAG: HAD family hydrolase [Acidimicrobiales bacterium]
MLGLPDSVRGCLFDMDGVLTRTAVVHAGAWKTMFDDFLSTWGQRTGQVFAPFDAGEDYDRYVDGRSREDGTRTFLSSRVITLPEGEDTDPPDALTVRGLGNRKNNLVLEAIARDGVDVYPDSIDYVRAARGKGLRRAVVSSSANAAQVLEAAGITDLFEALIDGTVAAARHLDGKPSPALYLAGAEVLGLSAGESAVFEDALAGVEAGRAGGFAAVVGVDRVGQADELRAHGADLVVSGLGELLERS